VENMTGGIRNNDHEKRDMTQQLREQSWERGGNNSALDQQLDAALAKYAAVEPRVGLEERILANLRAQREHAAARGWWRWAAAGALAMVVIILVVFLSWRTRKPQLVNVPNPVTKQRVSNNQVADDAVLPPRDVPSIRKAVTNRTSHSIQAATAAPHLSRFPSAEAMSDQEKMLAGYATEFQEQAVLIARFNEEDLRRDRMELVDNAQGNRNSSSFENEETKLR
jgi:hypothetical protein